MTKNEYITLIARNAEGMKFLSTGLCAGCETCQKEWGYEGRQEEFDDDISTQAVFAESAFSWSHCDICGTALGGNRECGHCIDADGAIVHFDSVCDDCMVYIANGDIPTRGSDDEPII